MTKPTLIQIIVSLLILLFTYTAISKLAGHNAFIASLHHTSLFGSAYRFIGWAVPLTELIVVILLIFHRTRLYGLYASMVLLWTFTWYIAYMLLYVHNLPCSCGGVLASLSWPQHLLFNIVFLLLSCSGILLSKKQNHQKSGSLPATRPGPTLSETKPQTSKT